MFARFPLVRLIVSTRYCGNDESEIEFLSRCYYDRFIFKTVLKNFKIFNGEIFMDVSIEVPIYEESENLRGNSFFVLRML